MLNFWLGNKVEANKTRHNLPLAMVKSRLKMEENKPRGHKIFVNYAAQIKGDTKNKKIINWKIVIKYTQVTLTIS